MSIVLTNTSLNSSTLTSANNDFSFSLYGALGNSEENIFFSPLSIQLVLFLVSIGTRGQTKSEIIDTIRLPNQQSGVLNLFKNMLSEFENYPDNLKLFTGIFVDKTYKLRSSFVNLMAEVNSSSEGVDFIKNSELVRNYLNDCVKNKTNEQIQSLFPKDSIDQWSRLVLANAIHFNNRWVHLFDPSLSSDEVFYMSSTHHIMSNMMHITKKFRYYKDNYLHYAALEIPYQGQFAMIVLLPDSINGLKHLEKDLSFLSFSELNNRMITHEVVVTLPSFNLEYHIDLKSTLISMGCHTMFDKADFSDINEKGDLVATKVIHKAVIKVNEYGTEAAAATGFIGSYRSAHNLLQKRRVEFKADHPFIFAITYKTNILFMGRVKKF